MNEHDDIGRELREARAEPAPEFARALDERAAEWLRERPRRRIPSLRIAIPALAAAATAAVVIAIAGSGGEESGSELEVAVVADRGAAEAVGGSQLELRKDSAAPRAAKGGFSAPKATRVEQGEPVVVRFFFTGATDGTIELAGREAPLRVPAGAGRLEIPTDDLSAGTHELVISVRSMPPYRQRIEIGG